MGSGPGEGCEVGSTVTKQVGLILQKEEERYEALKIKAMGGLDTCQALGERGDIE